MNCDICKREIDGGEEIFCPDCVSSMVTLAAQQPRQVTKQETHTICQYKRKSVYAKDSTKIPHTIRCSRHALYLVDGIPMCKTHAGNYLLNKQLPVGDREGVFVEN